jgi:molybdopterin converting factor small subunit
MTDRSVPDNEITVKVFADLRKFAPSVSHQTVSPGETIARIIRRLDIPASKVTVVFLNARHANLDDIIHPGDTLSLFPPVGGG